MVDKVVTLTRTYSAGGATFSSVTLREPTYNEIFMSGIGEPQEWQPVPGGQALLTYPERVDAYMQILVRQPGYEYLSGLGTIDAIRLKAAVCDFFIGDPMRSSSQTSSSSASDGALQTSEE
ncbi:hypothetical protein J2857_003619 [Neorhizobium galegae]|uniref:phage tail assembly protein n=1 Tax=Neorhizobium galegae TaxID=399 RepID=UPI001AE9700E|nr:phage tail assembly protein [Neorhizobium galegae]MBP2560850.1 hypothetical protein [Neorhizobium galegae]